MNGRAIAESSRNDVRVFRLSDRKAFEDWRSAFEQEHPRFRISTLSVDGERLLRTEHQGVRVLSLFEGTGEVFLPRGYRTQEGDGEPLPEEYRPDPIPPELPPLLERIQKNLASLSPKARVPVQAILGRWSDNAFRGDIAGDLWRLLEQAPRPWSEPRSWSEDVAIEKTIEILFSLNLRIGFSTKQIDSWEPIRAGDQLLLCGGETLRVRGVFRLFSLENTAIDTFPVSQVRRLRYLLDTAGGCSPDFDPFRRLPLTWLPEGPGSKGDGINFFNNHIVNIPEETSPTHFHPKRPIGGGTAQHEMYLVLDPAVYNLSTAGRAASILLFPDLRDLGRFEQHVLEPGMFVNIPPGKGHRGLNVFASIMTVPGFKPRNELYLDRDIFERTGGASPSNPAHYGSKNFERLEDQ